MPTDSKLIREVWANNLETEMKAIRNIVEEYPWVSMDTEFPGTVAKPIGSFKSNLDYKYQEVRCNVDMLKIIQLGLTFSKDTGEHPKRCCTWQFNFKFSKDSDMYLQESVDLLESSGIDFKKHEEFGIDTFVFGELLISSGLVLLDDVNWISFSGGYDYAYLIKVLTCSPLPPKEEDFFNVLGIYFPRTYDLRYLMRCCKNLSGGLSDLADQLQIPRIGIQHQAGSDSLTTASAFFKMKALYFENQIDDHKFLGYISNLGSGSNGFYFSNQLSDLSYMI